MSATATITSIAGPRFTVRTDAKGRPVQRPVSAMRGDELLSAVRWQEARSARLQPAADHAALFAKALSDGVSATSITQAEYDWASRALAAYATEERRAVALWQEIDRALPEWRAERLGLQDAVTRFWPR